jgi:hypothetical protein
VRRALVFAAAAALFGCAAGVARADIAVVANDGTTPFDGGVAVTSPLEQIAGSIASKIAGRAVTVRCENDSDWAALAQRNRIEAGQVLGFVSFLAGGPVGYTELSPDVCRSLQAFAGATTKPTKCAGTKSEPKPVTRTVRQKLVTKINGRTVVTWRTHMTRETTYVEVPLPFGACYASGRELTDDQPFWNDYFYTAEALQTLVHESIHLKGDGVEAEAECYGMQWLAYAAQQLGDTPDDAAAITAYYVTRLYPSRQSQSPDYWSPECRQNGALDLTPNDGVWP